jgi:lysophospholipase L1-like esterase
MLNRQPMKTRILYLIFIYVIIGGCSEQPHLPQLSSQAVILAFGDSLTYGSGAPRGKDYPSILSQLTGLKVVNAGVPGEMSNDALKRFPPLLDEHNPELVVLIHGGNDLLRRLDPETIHSNLDSMIRIAQKRGISVILLGVPEPGLFLSSADFYSAIAKDRKISIDTEILPTILANNQLKSDMIHPNKEGYRLIAQAVYLLLEERGAL